MTFGSLFAGVGGFELGFERAGLQCRWQVEIDPWCRRVLARHWPDVPRHDDVRTFPDGDPERYRVDVICGGFPCQDISNAGKRAGIGGERSGLWSEYARVIRVLRPRYVVVENVAALLGRGLGRVLGDLAACGYDAEWDCLPASALGAPHRRDRIWIVAYPLGTGTGTGPVSNRGPTGQPAGAPEPATLRPVHRSSGPGRIDAGGSTVPDPLQSELEGGRVFRLAPDRVTWSPEPGVCRVANGVPSRVDRLGGLGNAVVPQVAEWLGRRLMEAHREATPWTRIEEGLS